MCTRTYLLMNRKQITNLKNIIKILIINQLKMLNKYLFKKKLSMKTKKWIKHQEQSN